MFPQSISRRAFVPAAAGLAAAGCSARAPRAKSPVVILKAPSYSSNLFETMKQGAQLCRLDVRGKRVLLKPNLVEFDGQTCINTHPSVLAAAFELFQYLGAAQVMIGEGPGHRRDTMYLAEAAGYRQAVTGFDRLFVDLNLDDVTARTGFLKDSQIFLPNTALSADLIVSLPKMKTHHWAGVTLSMKNFFGLVPGAVYGWPKNPLHYAGIPKSIVELNRIFRRTFAIVDGVVGMEGNGPIQGTPKLCGVLVMGADLVAVDSTCCRIMGVDPSKVEFLRLAAKPDTDLGNLEELQIDQRGEAIGVVRKPFGLIREFAGLRLS
ncbi:MAG: DUF362 domain-containing protein [Acidobacteriia bacterium]|nr:DUF362 domain-containing protein [Terriglobia bacterium]